MFIKGMNALGVVFAMADDDRQGAGVAVMRRLQTPEPPQPGPQDAIGCQVGKP